MRHYQKTLLALVAGCSTIQGVIGGTDHGHAPTTAAASPSAANAPNAPPPVPTSDEDSVHFQNSAGDVNGFAAALAAGDMKLLAIKYPHAAGIMYFDADLKAEKKYKQLLDHFLAIEKQLATGAGGHALEIWGDGTRAAQCSADGKEALEAAVKSCKAAANTSFTMTASDLTRLADAYAEYDKKYARVAKIDKGCLHTADAIPSLLLCEAEVGQLRSGFEDNPALEEGSGKKYEGCGYMEYYFKALKIGGNKFGPFELHTLGAHPLDCGKLATKTKVSGEIKSAVASELGGQIVVQQGAPTFQQEGLEIYKIVNVFSYSKKTELEQSPCGDASDKVVCEASGSHTVRAYNAVAHWMKRAEVHRTAGRADRCKELLKKAHARAEEWTKDMEDAKKDGSWSPGLSYKTHSDGTLDEKTIIAKLKDMGEKADEQALGGWCAKK